MKKTLLSAVCAAALLATSDAGAATTYVGPVQTYSCASHTWANSLAASTAATTCTQPAVGDLANVASGTVLGNATGSTAAPTATSAPVLGVASTTNGTLGLFSSGTAFSVTIQNTGVTPGNYNFNLPLTAGSTGQALTSAGGGSSPMTWSNVVTAAFTVSSKTSSPYAIASAGADDWKRFDNSGAAGTQLFNMPTSANLAAGDNWCFLVATAQLLEIVANTGETITMGNVTGASAGNLQSNVVGSSVCIYMQSTTAAYVWASNGQWVLS
jgi:hypothetical protein